MLSWPTAATTSVPAPFSAITPSSAAPPTASLVEVSRGSVGWVFSLSYTHIQTHTHTHTHTHKHTETHKHTNKHTNTQTHTHKHTPQTAIYNSLLFLSPITETCEGVECGENKACQMQNGRPKCVCKPNCEGLPTTRVCGGDGKTYRNHCTLLQHNCHFGKRVRLNYYGKCRSKFLFWG